MVEDTDIVVVGAGMVGLAAAAALAHAERRRWRVCLVDAGEPLAPVATAIQTLRVSALSPSSLGLLAGVGALEAMEPMAQPYRDMRVWDASGHPFEPGAVHFSASDAAHPTLGSVVENDRVRAALLNELAACGVDVHFNKRLDKLRLERRYQRLNFADGTVLKSRLVVAADGSNSVTRRLLGIECARKNYAQSALVCHVTSELAHEATAWQQFNPGGPLALLPLADGRISIVCSNTPQRVSELCNGSDATLGDSLTELSNAALGRLQPDSPRASFSLGAAQATRYNGARTVLIGDAAHRVHPLAGQGANLGFADVIELVKQLGASSDSDDPGEARALQRYARHRRREARQTIVALDGLQRLFDGESAALRQFRVRGMRWFDSLPLAKRAAMFAAMGVDAGTAIAAR
ncbi:MAG: FAD-dependent monooxygenase [Pseudomonadota bacterium]